MYIEQEVYDVIMDVLRKSNMTKEAVLLEMSSNRQSAINNLKSETSFKLAYHMALVMMFEPTTTRNHWKGEIKGFLTTLERAAKIKGGDRLSVDVIRDVLWENYFNDGDSDEIDFNQDSYDWWISKIHEKYSYLVPLEDHKAAYNKMNQFYTDVCGLLSMKSKVDEIVELVKEL